MPKTTPYANGLLQLVFNNTDSLSLLTTPNFYISLHTGTPDIGGNQSINEAAYTGYARVSVACTSLGWTVSGNTTYPVGTIIFPVATGGSEIEAFFGIGTAASGGTLLYYGTINPTINVASGVTPKLTSTSMVQES